MFKRIIIVGLALLLIAGLIAADANHNRATAAAPVRHLTVTVDHGTPLNLSQPATSVFIANPDIADVQVMSSSQIVIFGKRTGETTFMATDASGHTLEERTVNVVQDLSELRADLNQAMPGNKIHVATVPNGIVLTGEVRDAATVTDAQKLAMRYMAAGGDIINRIRVSGSNQVNIRVRFAEVYRNIDNSLGFNWSNLLSYAGMSFGIATGNVVGAGSSILSNRPNNADLSTPNDLIGVSRVGGRSNINATIDALAQDGLLTILAEPNLTAMSGETAHFLAGGEFPITIPQGNNTLSVEFKPYGISLSFTPTIINDSRISLHVRPEVSELTTTGSVTINNNVIPALTTRRAETSVEVASGQSFAIAGLMDNEQTQTINKYPMLGDMPIIGALFRSDRFKSGQTELVIIITPYIVKPNGEQQLALPTDGLVPPTEADRYLDLRMTGENGNARPISGDKTAVRVNSMADVPVSPVTRFPVSDDDSIPSNEDAPPGIDLPAKPLVTPLPEPVAVPPPLAPLPMAPLTPAPLTTVPLAPPPALVPLAPSKPATTIPLRPVSENVPVPVDAPVPVKVSAAAVPPVAIPPSRPMPAAVATQDPQPFPAAHEPPSRAIAKAAVNDSLVHATPPSPTLPAAHAVPVSLNPQTAPPAGHGGFVLE